MAKNPRYTQQDYTQAMRYCIDPENDAIRMIIINPDEVNKEEVNDNLKQLIGTLKQIETPQNVDYNKIVAITESSISKLANMTKDSSKDEVSADLKELIATLKAPKEAPVSADRTDYSKLVANIEKLSEVAASQRDNKKEFIPTWVKVMIVFQALSTFGVLISNLIKH